MSESSRTEAPALTFAVVGRVNKGKSSIIATLAEDEHVLREVVDGIVAAVEKAA